MSAIVARRGLERRPIQENPIAQGCHGLPLTPQIGRIILAQLEEPKRESAIVLDGFKSWDAWDRQRLTGFLEELAARGFVARDPAPDGVRTARAVARDAEGREAATRGDFLGD